MIICGMSMSTRNDIKKRLRQREDMFLRRLMGMLARKLKPNEN